jgi:hypothetical protein
MQTLYQRRYEILNERLTKNEQKFQAQSEVLAKLEKKKQLMDQHQKRVCCPFSSFLPPTSFPFPLSPFTFPLSPSPFLLPLPFFLPFFPFFPS